MRIESVSPSHGGRVRYYGVQFYGASMGAYEEELRAVSTEEVHRFESDDQCGRLRDYGDRLKACNTTTSTF